MTDTKFAVNEYKRIMSQVDMNEKSKSYIINTCLRVTPSPLRVVPKPAIAAISGAAVIAAAVGIKKIYDFKSRP